VTASAMSVDPCRTAVRIDLEASPTPVHLAFPSSRLQKGEGMRTFIDYLVPVLRQRLLPGLRDPEGLSLQTV